VTKKKTSIRNSNIRCITGKEKEENKKKKKERERERERENEGRNEETREIVRQKCEYQGCTSLWDNLKREQENKEGWE
jgi:hypothetical protein